MRNLNLFCVGVCSGTESLGLFRDASTAPFLVSNSFKLVDDNEMYAFSPLAALKFSWAEGMK